MNFDEPVDSQESMLPTAQADSNPPENNKEVNGNEQEKETEGTRENDNEKDNAQEEQQEQREPNSPINQTEETEKTVPTTTSNSSTGPSIPKRSYEPFDPDSLQPETKRARIPGKFIDRFWEPLDSITMDALDKVLDLSLEKAIERYRTSNDKRFGAEKLLHKTWVLDIDPNSFKNRLQLTKLPKSATMHTGSGAKTDENRFILNYDILNRRKAFLETYLLAELKQLKQLQSYYNSCKRNYDSDANYLKEFEKTLAVNQSKMTQDLERKQAELSIDFSSKHPDNQNIDLDFNLQKEPQTFTPNPDDDINELLNTLNDNLRELSSNSSGALNFNERLQYFQSNLDMH